MFIRIVTIALFFLGAYVSDAQVTFVIESLPSATPVTDTIFVCGSFNDWSTGDQKLMLRRQLNGQLALTIDLPPGKYEYKFTRGSWMKVETNRENRYTSNRIMVVSDKPLTTAVSIQNWLDLGGARPLNYMIFYFFACAFQGIALCFLAYRVQKKDERRFSAFMVFNAVLIVLLMLLVLLETADQIWQTYFSFVFQFAFYCWGPLMLYFFYSFSLRKHIPRLYLYFIPSVIVCLFIVARLLNLHAFNFLSDVIWPPVTWGNGVSMVIGILITALIYFRIFHRFSFLEIRRNPERNPREHLLYYFFWISFVALLLIPFNMLLLVNGIHHPFVEDFHGIALTLSLLIFITTYFLWRYPEIIKEERPVPTAVEYPIDLVAKLKDIMLSQKPFKKADLTVSDLADLLQTKPHILSRLINDHYDKNFRDFLNAYRVEEFIALSNTTEYKHYTFLALAQEVGFNSKSTFNLAFKKFTNRSPREYFK